MANIQDNSPLHRAENPTNRPAHMLANDFDTGVKSVWKALKASVNKLTTNLKQRTKKRKPSLSSSDKFEIPVFHPLATSTLKSNSPHARPPLLPKFSKNPLYDPSLEEADEINNPEITPNKLINRTTNAPEHLTHVVSADPEPLSSSVAKRDVAHPTTQQPKPIYSTVVEVGPQGKARKIQYKKQQPQISPEITPSSNILRTHTKPIAKKSSPLLSTSTEGVSLFEPIATQAQNLLAKKSSTTPNTHPTTSLSTDKQDSDTTSIPPSYVSQKATLSENNDAVLSKDIIQQNSSPELEQIKTYNQQEKTNTHADVISTDLPSINITPPSTSSSVIDGLPTELDLYPNIDPDAVMDLVLHRTLTFKDLDTIEHEMWKELYEPLLRMHRMYSTPIGNAAWQLHQRTTSVAFLQLIEPKFTDFISHILNHPKATNEAKQEAIDLYKTFLVYKEIHKLHEDMTELSNNNTKIDQLKKEQIQLESDIPTDPIALVDKHIAVLRNNIALAICGQKINYYNSDATAAKQTLSTINNIQHADPHSVQENMLIMNNAPDFKATKDNMKITQATIDQLSEQEIATSHFGKVILDIASGKTPDSKFVQDILAEYEEEFPDRPPFNELSQEQQHRVTDNINAHYTKFMTDLISHIANSNNKATVSTPLLEKLSKYKEPFWTLT